MAFINVEKDSKTVVKASPQPVQVNQTDSLNGLNTVSTKKERKEKKETIKDLGMYKGRLKTEINIVPVSVTTFIKTIIYLLIFALIILLVCLYGDFKLIVFSNKLTFTVKQFNIGLIKYFGFLTVLLVVFSLVVKRAINRSVRGNFKKRYLSKKNIYIYDGVLVALNIILYLILILIFFGIINWINKDLGIMLTNEVLAKGSKVGLINIFKYVALIYLVIMMVLNSFKCIDIVYAKNRFIFDEEINT